MFSPQTCTRNPNVGSRQRSRLWNRSTNANHNFYILTERDIFVLTGQFLYEDIGLTQLPGIVSMAGENSTQETLGKNITLTSYPALKLKDRTVTVIKKSRRIYSGKQTVDCWFAKNNAAKLIDGQYSDYVVSHLFDTGDWANGTNTDWDKHTHTHTHNNYTGLMGHDPDISTQTL